MTSSSPASHKSSGRYMDFVGPIQDRKRTTIKRATQPVHKTPTKSVPAFMSISSPEPRAVSASAVRRPASAPRPVRHLYAAPVHTQPAPSREPISDVDDLAPDASQYSIGGKSPFLDNYSVDKRPLSDSIPERSDYHLHRAKNVYNSDIPDTSEPTTTEPVTVIDAPAKKSGLSTVSLIIITIIVGIAAGVGAYLLLPK